MNRRDAVHALGASLGSLPFFTRISLAEAREAVAAIQSGTTRIPMTLTAQQDALVTRLAEIIIPATDTPGAREARVNEFIDLILTEWYDEDERSQFLRGLEDVDRRSQAAHQVNFLDGTPEQQTQIVAALDGELMERVAASRTDETKSPDDLFFYQMKGLTLTGYYTSEIGMTEELQYVAIPGAFRGCAPISRRSAG